MLYRITITVLLITACRSLRHGETTRSVLEPVHKTEGVDHPYNLLKTREDFLKLLKLIIKNHKPYNYKQYKSYNPSKNKYYKNVNINNTNSTESAGSWSSSTQNYKEQSVTLANFESTTQVWSMYEGQTTQKEVDSNFDSATKKLTTPSSDVVSMRKNTTEPHDTTKFEAKTIKTGENLSISTTEREAVIESESESEGTTSVSTIFEEPRSLRVTDSNFGALTGQYKLAAIPNASEVSSTISSLDVPITDSISASFTTERIPDHQLDEMNVLTMNIIDTPINDQMKKSYKKTSLSDYQRTAATQTAPINETKSVIKADSVMEILTLAGIANSIAMEDFSQFEINFSGETTTQFENLLREVETVESTTTFAESETKFSASDENISERSTFSETRPKEPERKTKKLSYHTDVMPSLGDYDIF